MRTIRKPLMSYASKKTFLDEHGELLPTMTEQSHKNGTMVENIIAQYDRTGLILHVNQATASYGDFTEVNEYQESLNLVIEADNAFNALPAAVRKEFANDAGAFFEFATNPANAERMYELGLAVKPKEEKPIEVVVKNTSKDAE
ncbi:MAG: internal scaffolding protein [Microviridae sp.]|nr:MAG: internal scaffolding protein [Microviridae sp.]